jgi:diguanylate cyclase (GGDEF)-like protein
VIFDPEDRIVMANEAFRKLYADVSDLAVPGVTFEDFLRTAVERGLYPDAAGHESEWINSRLEDHRDLSGSIVERLTDGRWVLITERRMSNGGIAGLKMDITALKKAEAQRDHLAGHDSITGLPNLSLFTERLGQAIKQVERTGGALAVACMELTSLQHIRDGHGLDAGDLAIREAAFRLNAAAAAGETVSHIGGGQFLALRVGLADEKAALQAVETLLQTLSPGVRIDGAEVPLRVAVGVSIAPGDAVDPDALIRYATTAMHRATRAPGGGLQFYNAEMTNAAISRSMLEIDLHQAIEKDQLFLVYQPLVNAHSYKLVGAEVLVRWRHPKRGIIRPADFIPIAEETGLIGPIGEHVLKLASRQARTWRDRGAKIPVSVNLSAVQLADPNLDKRVLSIVNEAGLGADAVMLELTESAILRDASAASRTMRRLAAEGIRFALDDFGMQHSALSHLSDLPFDTLKIDRAFVARMTESRGHAALFQAIVAMIHSLGMTAIAEGVEQPSQLIYLQAYGCDTLQGYLFSPPVSAQEFEPFLSSGIVVPSVGDNFVMPAGEPPGLARSDAA